MEKKRDDAPNTGSGKKPDAPSHEDRTADAATDGVTDVKLTNETPTGSASSSDTPRDSTAGQSAGAAPVPPLTDTDNPETGKSTRGPIIGAIVVVAAIAAGGYYYAQNNQLVSADNSSQSASEQASPASDTSGTDSTSSTGGASNTDSASGTDSAGQAPATSSSDTNTPGEAANEASSDSSSGATGSSDSATETQQPADATGTTDAGASEQSGAAGSTSDTPAGPAASNSDSADTAATDAKESGDAVQGAGSPPADADVTPQEQAANGSATPGDGAASESAGQADSTAPAQTGTASSHAAAPAAAGATGSLPADIRDQLDRQSAQIIALRDQLESSQKQLAQLQNSRLQASRHEASMFVLNDVSRLVTMAQNELAISGNLDNAVASLETARKTIDQADAPVLAGLQGALAADIVALKSAPVVGVDALFSQVSALAERIDALPMIAPDQAGARPMAASSNVTNSDAQATQSADSNPATAGSGTWYERAWDEIKTWPSSAWHGLRSDLGGIVRVEKLADPNQVLLTVDQAAQLRANLKQNLHFAQQALLNGQQGIWTASLETVVKGLKQSFNQDSSDTQQALAQVQQLLKTGVRPQMPAITQSVKAVDETRNQLKSMNPGQE